MRPWFCCVAIALVSAPALAGPEPLMAAPAVCESETARHERSEGIPASLLTAIALAETGRWDDRRRASFAWPWTVTARGKGQYFPTKARAIAEVERLQAEGVRNIDVGCMQINLYYHGEAFLSLEEALDPATNVAYAAEFLKQLRNDAASWTDAAARYHSATPEFGRRYREKVVALWNGLTGAAPAAATPPSPHGPMVPIVNMPRDYAFAAPPVDWERTARLNARLAFSRAADRQSAGGETIADAAAIAHTASRSARSTAGSLAFEQNRQRQMAEWRNRVAARRETAARRQE